MHLGINTDITRGRVVSPLESIRPKALAFWKLDDAASAARLDASGNGYTLADNSDVGQGTGVADECASFDGTSHLSHADDSAFEVTGDTVWAGWVKFDATGSTEGIISKYTASGAQKEWLLYKTASDILTVIVSTDGGATNTILDSTGAVTNGVWYFVLVSWTEAFKALTIGKTPITDATRDQTSDVKIASGSLFAGTAELQLGAYNGGANRLTGSMDEWGIYNGLTASEADTTFLQGKGGLSIF